MRASLIALVLMSCSLSLPAAKLSWLSKEPDTWSAEQAQRVLDDSPWAQVAQATFPDPRDHDAIPAQNLPGAAEAGLAGPRGVSDGKWDGGVGSNHGAGLPTLQVLVRWETAEPVRAARERLSALNRASLHPSTVGAIDNLSPKDEYVISITGLVPARQYKDPASLTRQSSSDNAEDAAPDTTERLLENFMSNSALITHSGVFVRPRNARLDPATGTLYLVFPRTLGLQDKDKEALLSTRYGSLIVKKRFRLGEMLYKGHLLL